MFWDILVELCKEKEVYPNRVAADIGLSSASVTSWKNGSVPRSLTLSKLADYFNVTPEYLLGKEERKDPRKESSPFSSVSVVAYPIIGRVRAGYGMEPVEENSDEITYIPSNLIRGHTGYNQPDKVTFCVYFVTKSLPQGKKHNILCEVFHVKHNI